MTPYEKIRGQKFRKESLPLGEQDLARRPGANVNQLLQPWVTGLWLGRDTLSDEHLTGAAVGAPAGAAAGAAELDLRRVELPQYAQGFTIRLTGMSRLCRGLHWVAPLPGRTLCSQG